MGILCSYMHVRAAFRKGWQCYIDHSTSFSERARPRGSCHSALPWLRRSALRATGSGKERVRRPVGPNSQKISEKNFRPVNKVFRDITSADKSMARPRLTLDERMFITQQAAISFLLSEK